MIYNDIAYENRSWMFVLGIKQKKLLDEINGFKIDIVALRETEKKGKGTEYLDDHTHWYSS